MQALLPSFLGQVLRCTRQRLVPATSQLWLHSIRYSSKLGRVVFLGTPGFAAQVLQDLLTDSAQAGSGFEVCAVISRPGISGGNGRTSEESHARAAHGMGNLSPVERMATSWGLAKERILTPQRVGEASFMARLAALQPDLCVTAAYGALLPQTFLDLPRCGVVNIHPSLLPLYRGAAPVQRALMDGVRQTGVTLMRTVLRCDAGPILAQTQVAVDEDIQTPELTDTLFAEGSRLLRRLLPQLLAGQLPGTPQDDSQATHANKLSKSEGYLDLRQSAWELHCRVRALVGWPGTRVQLLLQEEAGASRPLELKVVRTRVPGPEEQARLQAGKLQTGFEGGVLMTHKQLYLECGDGSILQILEVGRRPGGSVHARAGPGREVADLLASLKHRRLRLPP